MKLLKITQFYTSYLQDFYAKRPELADKSFAEQKAALDYDAFGWADYWDHALSPLGYEILETTYNAEQMQRAWARENSLPDPSEADLEAIAVAQARQFRPDILWFDDCNEELLARIKSEVPSIKLVLGWTGSAIEQSDIWGNIDLILSCAPESVQYLNDQGHRAVHIDHGFDPRINDRLIHREKSIDFSFIGQLIRLNDYHQVRYLILEKLAAQTPIHICSPSADADWTRLDEAKDSFLAALHRVIRVIKMLGMPDKVFRCFPILREANRYDERLLPPVTRALKPFIRPAVFGLAMFQTLLDSKVTLNIHADSSPLYASNMRLFETTGVGTCMVVDWKENLHHLFEDGKEVVTYKSVDECVEKVLWLLSHPADRAAIALAGQKRTLSEYTFERRALQLDEIIKSRM
jgi:spore maturation protein CgeB